MYFLQGLSLLTNDTNFRKNESLLRALPRLTKEDFFSDRIFSGF